MHLRLLNCPEIKTKAVWVTRCPLKWQEFALLCLQCKYPAALSPSTLSAFVVVLFIYLCHQPSVSVFRKGQYSWWMRERGFWRQNLYPHALINLCTQKCHQDMNVSELRRFSRSLIYPTALQVSYFKNPSFQQEGKVHTSSPCAHREVAQIDQFLQETAAREANAKVRLQQFIEELLDRADRAEKQLQIISSCGTTPNGSLGRCSLQASKGNGRQVRIFEYTLL